MTRRCTTYANNCDVQLKCRKTVVIFFSKIQLGAVHKQRHGLRGEGVSMILWQQYNSTDKSLIAKSVTMGEEVSKNIKNCVTSFMDDPLETQATKNHSDFFLLDWLSSKKRKKLFTLSNLIHSKLNFFLKRKRFSRFSVVLVFSFFLTENHFHFLQTTQKMHSFFFFFEFRVYIFQSWVATYSFLLRFFWIA